MRAAHPLTELIPYLRGELSDRERALTAQHLTGCAACRAQIDALALTLTTISARIDELPAPDWSTYRLELHRKLAARELTARRWWQPMLVWGPLAAAGIAALALFTLVTLHRSDNLAQPAVEQLALADLGHTDVGLLRNYPVVERLDLLENYDVIEHLDELAPANPQPNAPHAL